jgi:cysteine desulfurase
MEPFWTETFGNSASLHSFGRSASRELEAARGKIARVLNCHPTDLVFTGSGTEANNLALRGVAQAAKKAEKGDHIITTAIEHHSVLHTVEQLCDEFGFDATIIPVDILGSVDPGSIQRSIRTDTVLISVMYANNEVGTIQPVADIGRIAQSHGIPFHTDAVQVGGKLDLDVGQLGADLLTLSAHKFCGPKGVGLLFIRRGTPFLPPLTGGGHERGLRPGTVNVAGNVGMAVALEHAEAERSNEVSRLSSLRDLLINGVLETVPNTRLTGHPTNRLADSATFVFNDCDGEALVMGLDLAGIAASTGSACTTGDPEPSFVLAAMGLERRWAIGSVRFTLGRWTTEAHIDRLLEALPSVVQRTRSLRM